MKNTVTSTSNRSRITSLTAGNSTRDVAVHRSTGRKSSATTQLETVDVNAKKDELDTISSQDAKTNKSWRNNPRLRKPWFNHEIGKHDGIVQYAVLQPEHHVARIVQIDEEDVGKLAFPIRIQNEYAYSRGVNKPIAHAILGVTPDKSLKVVVDHINGDHLDNRKCNLRIIPFRDNTRNKAHYSLNNTGILGLSRCKGSVTVNGVKRVYDRYVATVTDPNSPVDKRTGKAMRYTRSVTFGSIRTEEEARAIALDWLNKKRDELGYAKFERVRFNDYPETE